MFRNRKRERSGIFGKIIFGLLLLIGAPILLWINEGRVNFGDVAAKSQIVSAEQLSSAEVGELAAISGDLTANGLVGDDLFFRPAALVVLQRHVQMFAWVEDEENDEDTTYYTHERRWTSDPESPEQMEEPGGHENPPLPFNAGIVAPQQVTIGQLIIDPLAIELPNLPRLPITHREIVEGQHNVADDYVFVGEGTLSQPELGDVRVSYDGLNAGTYATVFGQVDRDSLRPYTVRNRNTLFRLFTETRDEAIARMRQEYKNLLWGFRFLGTFLMWMGVSLLFSPINAVLSFIPGGRQIGGWLTAGISFLIAIPLSLIIITIAFIAHNIFVLITVLLLVVGGIYLWNKQRGQGDKVMG